MIVFPLNFHIETQGAPHNGSLLLPAKFKPQAHVNYESRLFDWQDSLPKFKGLGFDCPLDNHGVEAGKTRVEVKDEDTSAGVVNEKGSCFCGKVKFTVQGKQIFNVLCHCRECTRNRGTGLVHIVGVVPPTGVKCTEGQEFVSTVDDARAFCSKCGCAVWNAREGNPFAGTFPATFGLRNEQAPNNGCRLLPARFRPGAHINYESRLFDSEDNWPKFKGFPQQNCLLTNAGDEIAGESKAETKTASKSTEHTAVTKFLEGLNLADKAVASIEAGFDNMTFISKLNDSEVEEWSKYLDLKPGFKVKLRQGVASLRK